MISVEIDPPRSVRIERTIEAARLLRDAGADLVNVSDSAMARVRMGAMAVAFGIQHDLDLETLVHVTTRDRNLMALESELLGAHALGVRNILALTGDPPRIGDYPTGSGVWDVDSIGLIEILARLNRGEDQAGLPDRPAGDVHDRLRARPDRRRHEDRVGPPGAQAGRRRPPRHDPAAVRRGAGGGDARGVPAPLRAAGLPGPAAARRAAARLGPPRRVPAQRGARASRSPRRPAPGCAPRAPRGRRPGSTWPTRCWRPSRSEVSGTYLMPSFGRYEQAAELVRRIRVRHPVRGGRRPDAPVSFGDAHRLAVAGGLAAAVASVVLAAARPRRRAPSPRPGRRSRPPVEARPSTTPPGPSAGNGRARSRR